MQKTTQELKVGDTIEVWWKPGRDTIIGLRPYRGPLGNVIGSGSRLAEFALNKTGMTCCEGDVFTVIASQSIREKIQLLGDPAYQPR